MTFVAVDVGNTSTAAGLWRNGRVCGRCHCDGAFRESSAQVEKILRSARSPVDGIAYSSVVPREDAAWRAFAKKKGLRLFAVSHRSFPVKLDYPAKDTIGSDRLCDALGALRRYGAPVIVMDFGTALTAAVITRDGVWRGGAIAPGFPLMRDYLFERTAKLPRMKIGAGGVPKIGRSTEEAMRFGALVGYRGMVREIVAEFERNFSGPFKLVATGGYAKWALRGSGMDFAVDPDLTLFGAGAAAESAALAQGKGRG